MTWRTDEPTREQAEDRVVQLSLAIQRHDELPRRLQNRKRRRQLTAARGRFKLYLAGIVDSAPDPYFVTSTPVFRCIPCPNLDDQPDPPFEEDTPDALPDQSPQAHPARPELATVTPEAPVS